MKKIIFGMAVLVIAGIVALNVNLSAKKSDAFSLLALANIEALANGEDVYSCNIFEYNRNYMEAWHTEPVNRTIMSSLSFTFNSKTYVLIAGELSLGRSIRVPHCEQSTGNCCKKDHIDKAPQYIRI